MEKPIFEIGPLMQKSIGTIDSYSFDGGVLVEEIELTSDLKGKIHLMRIENGVSVELEDLSTTMMMPCEQCLKPYEQTILAATADRQFYLNRPRNVEDPNDLHMINKKNMTIDLSEMIRQELILHFPVVSVCYTGCKGLCDQCGVDRNKTKCSCIQVEITEEDRKTKPLSALKDLLN